MRASRAGAVPPALMVLSVQILHAGDVALPPDLREAPDDPYRPRPLHVAAPPASTLPGGMDFGVQVNVDDLGLNIVGDAANEPSIAVDPTAPNRLVIGWRQFDTIMSNFRQAGWAYSHDGGRSWTFPGVIQPGIFRSDPVLGADAEGTIYYCSLRGDFIVHFFLSTDGGVTWGPQLPFGQSIGGDKQWFAIDRTGGQGHGNIYISWNNHAGCCGQHIFSRSTDGAMSFLEPRLLPFTPIFGQTAVDFNGVVHVGGIGQNFGIFKLVSSVNAQDPDVSFPNFTAPPEPVDLGGLMILGSGPNPDGLLGQLNVATSSGLGPTAGNVYLLCSVDPPGPDPLDVNFVRSTDGGLTWTAPVRVNDDAGDAWQWFGTMSTAPNGRIDVVWNDNRNSGVVNVTELFYSFSTDGGTTWSPNVALSPPWNSHVGWPNQNKIGDYYDMVSDNVGAHLAYAATFNGEQDVYYLRIGDYDCNGNLVPDTSDLLSQQSADCNANFIPDECELAAGTVVDGNDNGIIDTCDCAAADLDGSGDVGIEDFLAMIGLWGTSHAGPPDLDGDGTVGIEDFNALLELWGPCPR